MSLCDERKLKGLHSSVHAEGHLFALSFFVPIFLERSDAKASKASHAPPILFKKQ
jgi:hypothetical protein